VAKAAVCKTVIPRFKSGCRLQKKSMGYKCYSFTTSSFLYIFCIVVISLIVASKMSTALILWDGALTPRNFMKMFDIIDTAEKPLGLSLSPANGDTITIVVWLYRLKGFIFYPFKEVLK
jgi:hypothetical protein